MFQKLFEPKNEEAYSEITHSAFKSPCPPVDIPTVRSKTVFLGRLQIYAVPLGRQHR